LRNIYKLFLQILLCTHNLDKHQTMHNNCGRNKRTCTNMHTHIHISVSVIPWLLVYLKVYCSLKNWMFVLFHSKQHNSPSTNVIKYYSHYQIPARKLTSL
jgi:hypothetical protein